MAKYYCPFCSPRNQIHHRSPNGEMICGNCGDNLVKIPLIKPTKILGLLALFAFSAPLLISLISIFQHNHTPKSIKPSLHGRVPEKRILPNNKSTNPQLFQIVLADETPFAKSKLLHKFPGLKAKQLKDLAFQM